jgi:hypothetical protein
VAARPGSAWVQVGQGEVRFSEMKNIYFWGVRYRGMFQNGVVEMV